MWYLANISIHTHPLLSFHYHGSKICDKHLYNHNFHVANEKVQHALRRGKICFFCVWGNFELVLVFNVFPKMFQKHHIFIRHVFIKVKFSCIYIVKEDAKGSISIRFLKIVQCFIQNYDEPIKIILARIYIYLEYIPHLINKKD
jgi:hypothetical protein